MFRNYLKIAIRNLYTNKTYSLIKTIGLALALAVSIAIFSWVKHELSYDKIHHDSHDIHRLVLNEQTVSAPPGFKQLCSSIPEIDYAVRVFNSGFLGEHTKIARNDIIHTNDQIYYADEDFFNLFSFPLLEGKRIAILEKPNAAVITKATALKYFGNEDPLGKTLLLGNNKELEITGVMQNIPSNSHFHFDILVSMKSLPWHPDPVGFGSAWVFATYIKINNQASIEVVQNKLAEAVVKFPYAEDLKPGFQQLIDIHLHSSFHGELETNGDIKYVWLFSAIGLLIILIASINYVNLTTALAANRAREIGIRKAVGAGKRQLVFQIMGESLVISSIAFIIALILLEVMKPLLSSYIGVSYFIGAFNDYFILIFALGFSIVIGALTGLIPALLLAKFSIVDSLKSRFISSDPKNQTRGILVIFQFCISIILIIGSLVIFQQLRYVQHKKLGYNKEHVLVLHVGSGAISQKTNVLKELIAQNPEVVNMSLSSQLPTNIITQEGINTRDGKRYEAHYLSVDKHFFETMDMNLLKGKDQIAAMVPEGNTDWRTLQNRFVVNQALLKEIDVKLEDISGHTLVIRHGNMQPGPIIGVVEDFHFKSFHTPIRPLVFEFTPRGIEYLLVKTKSKDIPGTIHFIEKQWNTLAAGLPFDYSFLDEDYNALYKAEQQLSHLFIFFTLISIFIIILGLLGLISFITAHRTKEIGIRKVLGASTETILLMFSKIFLRWTIIANLIAWPLAWYSMHKWLQNFAYHIKIDWWIFALAGGLTLLIALITISGQIVRAALINPVETLKYE